MRTPRLSLTACPLCDAVESRPVAVARRGFLVRCPVCGLAYVDPPPGARSRRYYDRVYVDFEKSRHTDRRREALFVDFLDGLERVRARGGGRLLDVGCGTGEFIELAARRGWEARGVEVSWGAVQVARRHARAVHLSSLLDDDGPPFAEGSFDVVTLWNVVEFFQRPVEQLRAVQRLLAPGGLVFVRTPNQRFHLAAYRASRLLRWPPALGRFLGGAYVFNPLLWAPTTLLRLLATAGFVDARVSNAPLSSGDPYQVVPPRAEPLVRLAKRLVWPGVEIVYLASGRRAVLGPSLAALARKPGAAAGLKLPIAG